MANRIDIEVTGCKGCPFSHYQDNEYGQSWTDCKLEAHASNVDFCDVSPFAEADGKAPEWCPLRQDRVLVVYAGAR